MSQKTLNVKFIPRHDTEANWISANPVLLKGEHAYSTDKNGRYKIGDGSKKWSELEYNKADAVSATKLETPRTIRTNLGSTSTASFDGTANITPGVTGTLPIANGGTGATTAAGTLSNLGITATATELNYVDGVTSNVQTQLNAKAPIANPSFTGNVKATGSITGTDLYATNVTASKKMTLGNFILTYNSDDDCLVISHA